ncbi:sulfotransferase domain-containing protein [Pelagimonas varians]|uniref:Glycolipid sulfotransferase n=1 Tax=Pelagimonas varians TaxID=696760 RepID=A0A238K9L7_9RHOB|nr:sulfotransferase domain-containing protein [Pelagimonas varians]PYG31082.1 aryl sulfotransferase [Pelagimonas varians]SMX39600.1 Glycolipid sulfotransferase [Pelagimonas varians]
MLPPPEPPERRYVDFIADSSRWASVVARSGDVIVSTPPKSGTTWTQSILALLIAGDPNVNADVSMKSPWIDMTFRPIEQVLQRIEAQTTRRHFKSHSPLDCLPFWKGVRYITVYRHPIDVHFSFQAHNANIKAEIGGPDKTGSVQEAFHKFLTAQEDHVCLSSIVDHYKSALARDRYENCLRLHYKDMSRDLPKTFGQISDHTGLSHSSDMMAQLIKAAQFENMRANADRFTPSAGQGFWKNDAHFFDSGTSNKWEGKLTKDDLAAYDAEVSKLLSPSERRWLEWGSAAA